MCQFAWALCVLAAGCEGPRAYLELVPWKVWKVWKVHGNHTEKAIEPHSVTWWPTCRQCQWYKLRPIWGSNMANAMVRMRLEPPIVLAWNGSVIGPPYGYIWLNVNSPQVAQPLLQNSKQWFGFHMFSLGWIFRRLLLPFVANILRVW